VTIRSAVAVVLLSASIAAAEGLSKGHRLLIEHGLQLQGMVTRDDLFHLETYKGAHYTSVNFLWQPDMKLLGPAPGFPWATWVGDASQMPPAEGKLLALQFGDEKDLNNPKVRDEMIAWFQSAKAKYPDTILYANNFGGQVNDAALDDFLKRAAPDMIAMDTYPFRSDYTTRKPIQPPGGSPTNWYSDLRRYRQHAMIRNIPLATYVQTFNSVQDYDKTVYRDPSRSELRLNTFAALAFNVKYLTGFTYNTGAASLFNGPGDTNPTALYEEQKITNRMAKNLGPALVRLKPVPDAKTPDQWTTGMMIIRGRHGPAPGVLNDLPIGFVPDGASADYSDWESGRNDPYLRGWSVANTGKTNSGLSGDVILSWFHVLDESLDGDAHRGEVYLLITNGLSDMTGAPEDCRQAITLNFAFGSTGIAAVQRLSRETGTVEEIELPLVPGAGDRRKLVFELEGGTSELIKFKTGAPFVGAAR
jgi:hypothetical protein